MLELASIRRLSLMNLLLRRIDNVLRSDGLTTSRKGGRPRSISNAALQELRQRIQHYDISSDAEVGTDDYRHRG
jgi:hypothetical protein